MKKTGFIHFFLGFTKLTGLLPAWLFFKPKVYVQAGAKRRLPKPCILVSNHKSLLDFVLYLVVFPFRTVRFLMAEVLYNKGKLFSFMLNSLGGIRVDRDKREFSFVSDSIEVLDNGGILGVFPESRLPVNGKPLPFTTSTAFIATHADAPIVPVYTDGGYGLFKRARVGIGKAFTLSDYCQDGLDEQAQLQHLTTVLEQKVYALKDEMQCAERRHPLFHWKHIPMDLARLVSSVLLPLVRVKRLTPDGERYTEKIQGGAIIAANHTSFFDPFLAGITFWYRRMHFLVAEIVMGGKFRSWLLKGVGAIRIDRGAADIEAINQSIKKLKEGYVLTVFPQGEIHRADDMDAIKSGAVLMALRAGVPIIPIHMMPRNRWYQRRTVIIGNAIDPKKICAKKMPSTADINAITQALMDELQRCRSANNQVGGTQ